MTFQPSLPLSGLAGWAILARTKERQTEAFAASAPQRTAINTFNQRFSSISSVDALLGDRAVLGVVLSAFGLQEDLPNKAFIRRVITDGTIASSAIANRLSDKRYLALATALSHLGPQGTGRPTAAVQSTIVQQFRERSFELAVGQQNQSFRLALSFERELPLLLSRFNSDEARWFGVLGNPPLRTVVQTALGLPREFNALAVDQQAARLKAAAQSRFGVDSVAGLSQPDVMKKVVQASQASFNPVLTLLARPRG